MIAQNLQPPLPPASTTPGASPSFANPLGNAFGITLVGSYASPAFADIDNDGDLDLFIGDDSGLCLFVQNSGSASAPAFHAVWDGFGLEDVGRYASPSFADIDGDGDLDAFIGNYDGEVRFFRNSGTASAPAFTPEIDNGGLGDMGYGAKPAFVDIDGDGDFDAFVGSQAGTIHFFRNTGSAGVPAFSAETGNGGLVDVGSQASPSFADIDGDSDFDVLVGERGAGLRFFRNTGDATTPAFSEEAEHFGLYGVGSHANATFADLDGDGVLDVLVGRVDGSHYFFRNTAGSNVLPVVPPPPVIRYVDTAFKDGFAARTFRLDASDVDAGDQLGANLEGGTDTGNGTVTLSGPYGSLVLDRASREAIFTPNASAIEALAAAASVSITFTVTDGTGTVAQVLNIEISQRGTTESAGDDVLVGTAADEVFDALGGDDQIDGGAGIDTAAYGSAPGGVVVSLTSAAAQDTVSAGMDTLVRIENLSGSAFADHLSGNLGANRLDGWTGADLLAGLAGNDTYLVDNAGDVVTEVANAGTDTVLTTLASYTLGANVEIGRITEGSTAKLAGNSLNNTLVGGAGNNVLVGDMGVDRLTGGAGADTFDFNRARETGLTSASRDTITDFTHAQGDRLDLATIDANTNLPGNQPFTKPVSSSLAFSTTKTFKAAGQLYFDKAAHVLYGNTDVDPAPEFSLKVLGATSLVTGDFLL